jgi:hypothetical protein
MSSRTAATLHVTNGDAVVYLFKKAGILGAHVPWRDALHEGPLRADLSLVEHSRMRGAYLASRGLGNPIKILHDFSTRDAEIARGPEFDEIVLWFEHDLYDQLQILQVLVALGGLSLEPGRVSIVQSDNYLGSMTADEIVALHPKRRTVTSAAFSQARALWAAACSGDPLELFAGTMRESTIFPHMRAALQRLCEEYPWTSDGLSRSQRQALQAVGQGPTTRNEDLFNRAQSREESPFLGDRMFYAILDDLCTAAGPLIEEEAGSFVPTALGRRLLAGDGDWLEHAPADRYVGGVHLNGATPPRWDEARAALVVP